MPNHELYRVHVHNLNNCTALLLLLVVSGAGAGAGVVAARSLLIDCCARARLAVAAPPCQH